MAHVIATAHVIGHVGDVNPIDYGGGFILQMSPDDRPCLEYYEGLDTEAISNRYDDAADERIEAMTVRVYRADLECSARAFLSDLNWVDWDEIRGFTGSDPSTYTAPTLATPFDRACAACDVASYHGWANLDSYPLELTVAELRARWGGCHAR